MANHKSAIKRHKQSLVARARNRAIKSRIKNVCLRVDAAIESKNKEEAAVALQAASSLLDRAATKKVIHWKKAARKISRLSIAVNSIEA